MSETNSTPPVKPVIAAGAAKRANASVIGMLLAMFSTVAIVLAIVWLNPEPKADTYRQQIDVAAVAGFAADTAGFKPVAPELPESWSANYARWNPSGSDGVAFWDVGYVTANDTFIALRQTITANPTWLANQTQHAPVTGMRTIDGQDWELRDNPKGERSLVLERGSNVIVLTGTADFKDFDILASGATKLLYENMPCDKDAPCNPTTAKDSK